MIQIVVELNDQNILLKKEAKLLPLKVTTLTRLFFFTNGDPDSRRDMGPPDNTDVGKQNSLSLRNDSSATMAGNLTSTSRKPTKTLEDVVKDNEELEIQKAAKALGD